MSVAANAHDLREVEAFYKRWGTDVFVFCRLFLGDRREAEIISSEAFLEFHRVTSELTITGQIPSRLLGFAFRAMQPCIAAPISSSPGGTLESCIIQLDCHRRAAFIARNVLGMTWLGVANAISLSEEEVREFWLSGMLRMRELLPRDFFER